MNDYDGILVALRRITRAIDLQSKRLQRQSGLTAPQIVIMQALRKNGRLSPSEIAKQVSLSQATVTNILDRLDKAELIRRERSEEDRRIVNVQLSTKGEKKLESAPELLQSGFLREFRQLKEWERSQLIYSLQRVAEMLDAEDLDASPILESGEISENETEPTSG